MRYDAVIVGGGPAGLAAALALGRARKRVVLCDSGSPRNARAAHVQNFVTRDGVPPREFRRIARQELGAYPNVAVRDERVQEINGELGAFAVQLTTDTVEARRILLATGMIDEIPDLEGFAELWGTSIFQCPYCHGWEVQDQRFAYLATSPEAMSFALLLRGWTSDVVVLTDGKFEVPEETRTQLAQGEVRVEERSIQRLSARNGRLAHIEFLDGPWLERDAVFVHPRQTQVPLVQALGLAVDEKGFVRVDEATRETSIPGVYAAGDLTTAVQGAVLGAAAGMLAAAKLNHALTVELATAGALAMGYVAITPARCRFRRPSSVIRMSSNRREWLPSMPTPRRSTMPACSIRRGLPDHRQRHQQTYVILNPILSRRYGASKRARDHYYVLTVFKEPAERTGPGLVKLNVVTGKEESRLWLGDRTPEYEVDAIDSIVFFKQGKRQIVAFRM